MQARLDAGAELRDVEKTWHSRCELIKKELLSQEDFGNRVGVCGNGMNPMCRELNCPTSLDSMEVDSYIMPDF